VERPSNEEIERQPHRDNNFDWSLGVERPSETARTFYGVELFVYEDKPRGDWLAKFRTKTENRDGEIFETVSACCTTKGAAVAYAVSELLDAIENGEVPFQFAG